MKTLLKKVRKNKIKISTIYLTLIIFVILPLITGSCQTKMSKDSMQQKWVGTWSTAPQLVEPRNMPPEPGLSNNTLRQILRVSIGGDSLRVRFSNEFSSQPVTMKKVVIAASLGESSIDTSSISFLEFNGSASVTMPAGTEITSDPLAYNLKPRMDIAISIFFEETSPDVTGHPGSRTTSYIIDGNQTEQSKFESAITADRWYVINGIDVKAPKEAAAIAILGNSITDGRGSGTNKQNRWPDILAEQLQANAPTNHIAVLNQGIGGNCVLRQCLGPAAMDRFERDVLKQSGVKWLIILEGVNDLGQTPNSTVAMQVANDLIAAYSNMIELAHENAIKVYGATILPFGKSFYYADYREPARNFVNEWIRTSGKFDAVIDFDSIMRNPEDTISLLPDVHSGDYLHPNEHGYELMGSSINLNLFY